MRAAHRRRRLRPEGLRGDAPGALENFRQNQHRHVAANAVAFAGDGDQFVDLRLLQLRIAVVELQRVGPTGIVGVASVREDSRPPIGLDPHVVLRRAANLLLAALHVVVRVGLHPGMIRRRMVRHEIQHQLDTVSREPLAKLRQRRVVPNLLADGVTGDCEAGAADVVLFEIGQDGAELGSPFGLAPRDGPPCGAGPPDAQQPNPVEALQSEAVNRCVVNLSQGRSFAALTGQASQPDTGIELIEGGIAWRDCHGRTPDAGPKPTASQAFTRGGAFQQFPGAHPVSSNVTTATAIRMIAPSTSRP